MKPTDTLQAVLNTLNQVSVSGYENLNRLLGCMQTLQTLKNDLEKEKAKTEDPT